MPEFSSHRWWSFWGRVNARIFQSPMVEFLGAGQFEITMSGKTPQRQIGIDAC
jgi:hypothetical protein